jgi:hypothetical protein
MKSKQTEIAVRAKDSCQITETAASHSLFTRREMLGMVGMAGVAALTNTALGEVPQTQQERPRLACLVSFWGAPGSHADWIIDKLMDGYWWKGAHTPSRVEVVAVYLHQFDTSLLGQKICKAKTFRSSKQWVKP